MPTSNLKRKFCVSAVALFLGSTTFYNATAFAQSSPGAQAREDIAAITNDNRSGYTVRQEILSVLDHASVMASSTDLAQLENLKAQILLMSDQEVLGTFSRDFMQTFAQFMGVFDNLENVKTENLNDIARSAAVAPKVIANVNLRNAVYNNICGDTRADTTATIAALAVFLVAEAVKEAAVSGCGTVVVVAGVGGSPQSAVCSGVVAGVFQIARGVWEEFLLCQDSIDSAEILGTYERAEDIFNLVNEHDTEIKSEISAHDSKIVTNLDGISDDIFNHDVAIKGAVDAHDMDIKSAVNVHDVAIKAVVNQHDVDIKSRLDSVSGQLDTVIDLLLTPQGQRPGWNGR